MTSSDDDDESKDDDPVVVVDDQDEDEEENASDEQDSGGSSSDEESSSDNGDDDESKEDGQVAVATTEDGHQLSAYEVQRLERIRRNKEYLASLGLEKNKPRPQKPQPTRKKRDSVKLVRRSSLSRTTKAKPISYSENPTPRWQKATSGDASATQSVSSETLQRKKKQPRMERFVYDEFKRIEADVKRSLKTATRNMREADIAYRYASKKAERYERKQQRELEYKRSVEDMERERKVLGCTAKEMLQQVDSRMYEIQCALRAFDQRFQHQANLAKWAEQQEENARKMEILDAMDRFPRALKDAVQDLDLLLLERSPRDPPPPRRGSRKRDSSTVAVDEPEQDAKKRSEDSPDASEGRLADGSWGSLAAAITAENLSSSAQVRPETTSPVAGESDSQSATLEKPKKKKREAIPKNVGGWVSPAFAKDVDRSWLESDNPPKKFDAARYIPQIGDTIVYYPAGHRAFLKVHPDILGKKTRNITRMTLWERAKKEKAKVEKAALDEGPLEEAVKKQAPQESVDKVSTWWNEEWLAAVEEDLGRYPIICRVEKTHVEFPPDPYAESKIITKDDQSGGVQVTWALPKDSQKKKQSNPPLCLAVMLRPLTPVLPPRSGAAEAASDDQQLSLAPNFYVVTFPSKVSPFILPFSWAYRSTYSLSTGLPIRLVSKPEWRGKVKNFRSLDGEYGSGRLEDKIDSIRVLWKALKSGANSFAKSLEQALSSDTRGSIPITDACTVIERLEALLDLHGAEANDSKSLSTTNSSISMMELIRSTLPLWKEVIVESGMGKKLATSAWELIPIEAKMNAQSGPLSSLSADVEKETGLVYIIDEPLRAKIEFTIEGFLKDTPDSSMFRPLVSDEEAPSYSCAVPRGMAFDKILRRLKARKQTSDGVSRCYYRSVDSLLGDISAVADNCVLYNSPDSYVVEQAMEIVPTLKRLVTQVASSHFKEKEAREKSVEERRQAILMQVNAPALINDENDLNDSTPRSRGTAKREALQAPYTEPLHRSWIQDAQQDGSWKRTRDPCTPGARSTPSLRSESSAEHTDVSETPQVGGWVPQSGDTILYSRALHSDFVKGHHPSLLTMQCTLPRFTGEGDSMKQSSQPDEDAAAEKTASSDSVQKRWLVGKLVWVRASFPRAPSKRDTDYENTFEVASPILALGIRFNYSWASNKIHTIYWRPCVFGNDSTGPDKSASTSSEHSRHKRQNSAGDDEPQKTVACEKCAACHLRVDQSFVRPAWVPIIDPVSPGNEEDSQASPYLMPDGPLSSENMFAHPNGLSDEAISSIDRCLNMLKRRCLASIPPDYIDPKFSKENVKKGWTPAAKPGKKLPTFERLLVKGISSGNEGATRGIEKVDMNSVALLANSHYLPPWTSSLSDGSTQKTNRDGIAQSLSFHETLSPNPNLCLELIQHRLRNGYYRDRSALAHDIEDAYVSSVLLILSKPAAAKKGKSVSMRRIAKGLSSQEILSSPKAGDKKSTKIIALSEDEKIWVDKINRVRKLYGTALVCVTETECMERMFGTALKKKTVVAKVNESVDQREQIFKEARNKLGFVFAALQRDPCMNRASQASITPIIRVKVRFAGQDASPKEIQDENHTGSNDVVDTTKPILFEHKDYEDNDALVRLFFGHPGRMASCGRCRAYGRSAIVCRLYRRHSLPDFDWNQVFRGVGGLDGLLHMLRTGLPAVVTGTSSLQPPALLNGNAGTEDAEGPNTDRSKPDAATVLEKAKVAIAMANSLLEKARRKAQAPIRLSEEFIRSYFPVDPSDGHYNYCTICGLSGDVVCCEGCPNVAHPHCVMLSDIPDDDWYCSTCTLKSNEMVGKSATESGAEKDHEARAESQKPPAMSKPAAASDEMLAASASIPDDANENDDTSRLEDILNDLKSLRPKRPSKQGNASELKEGMFEDEDDDVEQDDNDDASTKSVTIEIGTKVRKSFGIYGVYTGTVLELPTSARPFYRVRYEDGDEEDMEEDELKSRLERDERRGKRSSSRGTREAVDEPEPDNVAKQRLGRPQGIGKIEEPAPVLKRGRGRPPKRQAAEVEEPVSAAKRGRGPPTKRQAIEIEEPVRQKRKPRTCQVENCPDPDNCPGRSHRDSCWSFKDETDRVSKRRGTPPRTGKKRRTRTCKVENCPDPKACPGRSHRGSCWSFKEKDTIPNERDPPGESPPKKRGLWPPEESPPKKRGLRPRR